MRYLLSRAKFRWWALCAAMSCALQAAPGHAATISATGNLAQDDSVATFTFTLSAADNVTLRTFSYAGGTNGAGTAISAGGFDPTLALFDDAGNLLMSQDDATPECSGVDSDPVTSECFDVLLTTSLAAGSYLVAITQFDNHALGPTWADGFSQSGANFTAIFGCAAGQFCDVDTDSRTSFWAADVSSASLVAAVPIPSMIWIWFPLLAGLMRARSLRAAD